MKRERLNASNYHSLEMNNKYWSASLLKSMLDCPARAMAELNGEYERPKSEALMVGSYVDAAFESKKAFQLFKSEHPEIFKKDGSLKAEYARADAMIQRAKSDKTFMEFMKGRKQVIKTATLWGVPFKAKFDVLKTRGDGEHRIVDLKTVKDLSPVYKPGQGKLDFASAWNWPLQMALYQKIEGHNLPVYLCVITKQDPPDITVVKIPQARLDAEIDFIGTRIEMFKAMRAGVLSPDRCENCAYCRATRKLTEAVPLDYYELINGGDE
ncbi:MAG: PD-(D/E)XK nuclease-like domain-containing protein [Clostridia bacterium]|nr:PD-(D/E)XK nuclease-like domain-containing protein [Clostridia bacterium]